MLKFVVIVAAFASQLIASQAHAICPPTENMFAGTHYKAEPPEKRSVSKGVHVHGDILSALDCKAITNARIEYWQAASDGYYTDRLRAWFTAGKDGAFQFETEWPGAPVPHIHFIVSANGYKTVTTQWIGGKPVNDIEINFVLNPEQI